MKNNKITDFVKEELKNYFNENKDKSTNYKKGLGSKQSPKIHKDIQKKVKSNFGLETEKKIQTNTKKGLSIDFYDVKNKIAYEIVLGQGEEFFKDVLKALLIDAKELVIFCRHYPDKFVNGHKTIINFEKSIHNYLQGKLIVKIINIFD